MYYLREGNQSIQNQTTHFLTHVYEAYAADETDLPVNDEQWPNQKLPERF
jgi:hypothetical protein